MLAIKDDEYSIGIAWPNGLLRASFFFKYMFYGMCIIDIDDDLPKWSGHKNRS